jgi:hypothetical protein
VAPSCWPMRLSEGSMGIMGRTPDYMNMKFAAFASSPGVWAGADGRNQRGAQNLVNFQRHLADADLSLTHTIIQPTTDKRTDSQILGNKVTVRKVGQSTRRHHRERSKGTCHVGPLCRRADGVSGATHSDWCHGICSSLRHPARHAWSEIPVP